MYEQRILLMTKKPDEIAAFDTIVYPFDFYIWGFTFSCILVKFILLLVIQNVWHKVTETSNPIDYVYEGLATK